MMGRLLRQLSGLLLLNLISKPVWILAENAAQDHLGHAAWGRFAALMALAYIASPLIDLGTNQLLTRQVAARSHLYGRFMGQVLGLKGLLVLVYLLVLGLLALLMFDLQAGDAVLLAAAALIHIGLSYVLLWRSALQAHQLFGWDGLASVLDKLVFLGVLGLLFIRGFGIEAYAVALTGVTLLTAAGLGALVWRRFGRVRIRFKGSGLRVVAAGGWPFALLFVLSSLTERVGQVLLDPLAGEAASGLYAGAFRWYGAFSMYLWTVLPVLFARFAQPQPPERAQGLLEAGLAVVALPVLWVAAFIGWEAERLFFLFGGSSPIEIAQMAATLRVLALALAVNGLFNIFSTWLTATGREGGVNRLLVLAAGLSLVLNALLIPVWGPLAPAVVLVVALGFLSAGYGVLVVRAGVLRMPWGVLGRVVLAAGVSGLVLGGSRLVGGAWWGWVLASGLVLAGLVLVLRLVDWQALRGRSA